MPRSPSRLVLPTLALIAFTLLTPTLATAFPQGAKLSSTGEHADATPGVFARIWDIFSAWMTGSILEPNSAGTSAGTGADPDVAGADDIGSILDPNG